MPRRTTNFCLIPICPSRIEQTVIQPDSKSNKLKSLHRWDTLYNLSQHGYQGSLPHQPQDPSPPPPLPPLPTSAFPTMMMMNSSSRTATSSSSATSHLATEPGNSEWPGNNSWHQQSLATAAGNNSGTYIPNWSDIFPPPPEGPPPPLDHSDSQANTPRSARRRQQVCNFVTQPRTNLFGHESKNRA